MITPEELDQRCQDLERKLNLIEEILGRHEVTFDETPARHPLNPTGLLGTTQEVPGACVEERIENAVLSILLESGPGHASEAKKELAALHDELIRAGVAARGAAFKVDTADSDYECLVEQHAAGAALVEEVDKRRLLCEQAEEHAAALLGQAWRERHAAAIATVVEEAAKTGRIFRTAAEVAAGEAMNLVGEHLAKASAGSQAVA